MKSFMTMLRAIRSNVIYIYINTYDENDDVYYILMMRMMLMMICLVLTSCIIG